MRIKPMIADYALPGLQRIGTIERRALVEYPVPGLEGSYHQDLGSDPVAVVIEGTLSGDDARDAFLEEVRARFAAGEPVPFVADIVTATAVEEVHLEDVEVQEVAGSADSVVYRLVLVQHVPPPPPAAGGLPGLGGLDAALGDLEAALDLEALDLLDVLQIPDLLGAIPELSDPTPPLAATLDGVRSALEDLGSVSGAVTELFG